jgi:hypothetical protein
MKSLMALIWLASFLEKENASRTSRETRCLSVLLKRSIIGSVLKVEMLTSFGDFISFKTETCELAQVTYLHM